jgi:hypothetical protein
VNPAESAFSIIVEITKLLLTVSLAFIAGFLAFLAEVKPTPPVVWANWTCLIGLSTCAVSCLAGVFWAAILVLREEDVLSSIYFFTFVVVGLITFCAGLVGGVVSVLSWL